MYEQTRPSARTAQQDALDINDFVFAATGARVRRLTLPDGSHWFPASDVCRNLGYSHTGSTLRNVADLANTATVETVLHEHCLDIPAGREWRRDMKMVNLEGLIRLVNQCTKPEAEPFKRWVTEVVITVQREGSYTLPEAPTPAAGQGARLLPTELIDVITRIEAGHAQRMDQLMAVHREERKAFEEMLVEQAAMKESLERLADRLETAADRRPAARFSTVTEILDQWKALVPTEETLTVVANHIVPVLAEHGTWCGSTRDLAERTGLPRQKVELCLRYLCDEGLIRQRGVTPGINGRPVYVLGRP